MAERSNCVSPFFYFFEISVEDIRQSVAFKVRKQHTAEVLTRL